MEVSKGIPMPENRGAPRKYPFDKMEIGDSFDVPIEDGVVKPSFYSSARHAGMECSVRKIESEGVYRVWRTK